MDHAFEDMKEKKKSLSEILILSLSNELVLRLYVKQIKITCSCLEGLVLNVL